MELPPLIDADWLPNNISTCRLLKALTAGVKSKDGNRVQVPEYFIEKAFW